VLRVGHISLKYDTFILNSYDLTYHHDKYEHDHEGELLLKQPWNPANATREINALAADSRLDLSLSVHAKSQMADRSLIVRDVLYVLKKGMVYEAASQATQIGLYKYLIETRTPNSGNRSVRVVAVPDTRITHIKVITVMWVDE
jgi:hypothetical protein